MPSADQNVRRRWLILSHAFNMDGRAASLTITDKIPFLMAEGVSPEVLSGVMGERDTRFSHRQCLPWGAAGLRFDLRHVLSQRLGKGLPYRLIVLLLTVVLAPFIALERLLLGLRTQWSWALPAYVYAKRRLATGQVDVLYTTGGAYSAHLAGYWLKRRTGCKWIAEIHDPLVIPGVTPTTRDARFQAKLEGWICRHADAVWWFTDGALAAARARHPELGDRGFMVLPGANPPVHRVPYQRQGRCVFGHFGSLADTRSLAPVVLAMAALLRRRPELRACVQVAVYGGALDAATERAIQSEGLTDVVVSYGRLEQDPATGLSGRERVMEKMQLADVLLMMHGQVPECAEYIPSKLYDYLWAQRPVLAINWRNPQLDALVKEHSGLVAHTDDPTAIEAALEDCIQRWQADALPCTQGEPVSVQAAVRTIVDRANALP